MKLERRDAGVCRSPFPIHEALVPKLLEAHASGPAPRPDPRDETVAHVLGTCAGYAYADVDTVAMMMARLGLERSACVCIGQTVDAMYIFSTAFLVQSHCGRVVILCYRGTEPANLGNWLGDADIGPDTLAWNGEPLGVHAGFYRNMRATRWAVLEELTHALEGRSLLDPSERVEYPLETLLITGHSLGAAMAVLFAISLASVATHRAIAARLQAVYTYGQPMTLVEPIPEAARRFGTRVFRHMLFRDVVPTLPPAHWGHFAHVGYEYRYTEGAWHRAETPVTQLEHIREIPQALLGSFATGKRRDAARFAARDHGPHHYIAALRPRGLVTEFGDYE